MLSNKLGNKKASYSNLHKEMLANVPLKEANSRSSKISSPPTTKDTSILSSNVQSRPATKQQKEFDS
jgi:hypothetical protein